MSRSFAMSLVGMVAIAAACAPTPSGPGVPADSAGARPSAQPRTLVMMDRHEPQGLLEKILAAGTSGQGRRLCR